MKSDRLQPSPFQESMQTFFRKLQENESLEMHFETQGEKEVLHKYTMSILEADIWIYQDGANILGAQVDERYEIHDFECLQALEDKLKADIRARLGIAPCK